MEFAEIDYDEFDKLLSGETVKKKMVEFLKKEPVDVEKFYHKFREYNEMDSFFSLSSHYQAVLAKLIEEKIIEFRSDDKKMVGFIGLTKKYRQKISQNKNI